MIKIEQKLAKSIIAQFLPAGHHNTLGYAFESPRQKKIKVLTWVRLVDDPFPITVKENALVFWCLLLHCTIHMLWV